MSEINILDNFISSEFDDLGNDTNDLINNNSELETLVSKTLADHSLNVSKMNFLLEALDRDHLLFDQTMYG